MGESEIVRKLRVFEVSQFVESRPRTDIAGRAWLRPEREPRRSVVRAMRLDPETN